jgi:hypothetical protein
LIKVVRVNKLAAKVHLDKLGIGACGEAVGDIFFPVAPIVSVTRTDGQPTAEALDDSSCRSRAAGQCILP